MGDNGCPILGQARRVDFVTKMGGEIIHHSLNLTSDNPDFGPMEGFPIQYLSEHHGT